MARNARGGAERRGRAQRRRRARRRRLSAGDSSEARSATSNGDSRCSNRRGRAERDLATSNGDSRCSNRRGRAERDLATSNGDSRCSNRRGRAERDLATSNGDSRCSNRRGRAKRAGARRHASATDRRQQPRRPSTARSAARTVRQATAPVGGWFERSEISDIERRFTLFESPWSSEASRGPPSRERDRPAPATAPAKRPPQRSEDGCAGDGACRRVVERSEPGPADHQLRARRGRRGGRGRRGPLRGARPSACRRRRGRSRRRSG